MTVWSSGLRRWLQAPVRKGVGSNPTAVSPQDARGVAECRPARPTAATSHAAPRAGLRPSLVHSPQRVPWRFVARPLSAGRAAAAGRGERRSLAHPRARLQRRHQHVEARQSARPWLLYRSLPVPAGFMCREIGMHDSLAEWSKALASGASPQGCGLEPHSCQLARRREREAGTHMSTTLDLVHISRVDEEPRIEQLCPCRHIFSCSLASYIPHCGM